MRASADAGPGGATIQESLQGSVNGSATANSNTVDSSASVNGEASLEFAINVPCGFTVSGNIVTSSSPGNGGVNRHEVQLAGTPGVIFDLTSGSDGMSGMLPVGVYTFSEAAEPDGSDGGHLGAGFNASAGVSGSLKLSCPT
jgi:hypothetical protein